MYLALTSIYPIRFSAFYFRLKLSTTISLISFYIVR